jgi:phage/plasmid-like protein (TIGR03299 family)
MDTRQPLAVVGRRFRPIQNDVAFQFLDHLVEQRRAVYERAGEADGGRRVWIQAKLPGGMWVTREDEVERFLLLYVLHGGGSVQVVETPVRISCKNRLARALAAGRKNAIRIRHAGDIELQVREAEEAVLASLGSFDAFLGEAKSMVRKHMRKEALELYLRTLVPDPKDADPVRAKSTRESLVRLFETGKGNTLPTVRGTLWAAVNGVVEFVDYERPTRRKDGEEEAASRWNSAAFGTGRTLKTRAWREALALLG